MFRLPFSLAFYLATCKVAVAFQPLQVPPCPYSGRSPSWDLFSALDDVSWDQVAELKQHGFPHGLCETMVHSKDKFARRFWIVDDSGSMATPDGTRLANNGRTMVSCTRWKEVQDTVEFHAKIASALQAPTSFRLLNNDGPGARMEVGLEKSGGDQDVQAVRKIIQRAEPYGVTPLARKITEIKGEIEDMLPDLQKNGQRVALIIATDGLPTDDHGYGGEAANEELGQALSSLQGLPIWLVIRLCTDEDKVVSFYNQLDSKLELSMDVLDDWKSEAVEVQTLNRWVNYGLPLHRVREMGCVSRVLDLLDERQLTKDEVRDYCGLLLGEGLTDGLPDPQVDWQNFKAAVAHSFALEDPIVNPVVAKAVPWVNLNAY